MRSERPIAQWARALLALDEFDSGTAKRLYVANGGTDTGTSQQGTDLVNALRNNPQFRLIDLGRRSEGRKLFKLKIRDLSNPSGGAEGEQDKDQNSV